MKVLKFSLLLLAVLMLVIVTTVALVMVRPNWFRQPVSQFISTQSGFQVTVGRLASGIQPASFEINELELENDKGEALLSAEKIRLELNDWPTLSAPFFKLNIIAPQVRYTLDENGNSNWPQSKSTPETDTQPGPIPLPQDFTFYAVTLERGKISIDLPQQHRQIDIPRLALSRTAEDRAKLELLTEIDGERFELAGDFTLKSAHQLALDLVLKNSAMQTQVDASLSTRAELSGSKGHVSFSLQNTQFLSRLLGVEIPELPRATISTDFSIDSHYRLSELDLQLGEQSLRGSAEYSPAENHLTTALKAERLDLDALLAMFQSKELAEAGGEAVTETVTEPPPESEKSKPDPEAVIDWTALNSTSLDAEIAIGAFSGQGWQANELDAHLVVRVDKDAPKLAIAASAKDVAQLVEDKPLSFSSLAVNAEMQALALKTSGADATVKAKVTLNDKIHALTEGTANLNGLAGQALSVNIEAPETQELWDLAKLPYKEAGALTIKGDLRSENDTFKPDLLITLGEQRLELDASYTWGERPYLSAALIGKNLDTRFTSPDAPKSAQAKKASQGEQEEKQALFSTTPIDTSLLRSMDAEVSIDVNTLITSINTIDQLSLIAQLKDGRLTTRESRVKLPENELTLSMDGTFRESGTKAQLELTLDTQNAGRLGLEQAANITGGKGKMKLTLDSSGQTPHQLASNLNGNIDTRVQNMVMKNSKINLVGSDILTELITKLNPFAKSDPVTYLECVSLQFDIQQGVMESDKGLHVETNKMKIIGDGNINLDKETLSFHFTPIARKGLGVNLSYLAKLVKLRGDIQSPSIGVDAGGVVSSALSTSAAMATGGASLIAQNLIERATNSGSACDPNKKLELDIPVEPEPDSQAIPAQQSETR